MNFSISKGWYLFIDKLRVIENTIIYFIYLSFGPESDLVIENLLIWTLNLIFFWLWFPHPESSTSVSTALGFYARADNLLYKENKATYLLL